MSEHVQSRHSVVPAAVLLAAGEGSRLGGIPKSLLTLKGQSLLTRQLAALRLAKIEQIVVVTGYFHSLIEADLKDQGVVVIRNPTPEAGQQSSVRLGLAHLRDPKSSIRAEMSWSFSREMPMSAIASDIASVLLPTSIDAVVANRLPNCNLVLERI